MKFFNNMVIDYVRGMNEIYTIFVSWNDFGQFYIISCLLRCVSPDVDSLPITALTKNGTEHCGALSSSTRRTMASLEEGGGTTMLTTNRFWYETFRPPETCTMSMCVQWMYQRPEISVRRNTIKHILSFAASIIMCDHKTDKNRHLYFSGKLVSRSNCVVGSSVNRESGILRGYYAVKWTQCARKSSEYRPMIRVRRSKAVQFAIERTREGIGAGRSSISSGG